MKRLVAAVLLAVSLGGPLAVAPAGASGHSATVVATTSKGWLVSLAVAKTTVRTGAKLSATITIVNRTGHSATVEGCLPNFDFMVILVNAKVRYQDLSGAVACSTTLRRGTTVIHTQIIAVRPTTTRAMNPDLPVGTYHTVVNWPTGPAHIPKPGRLYIGVVG
jgi:hypothetical protein